MSRSRLSEYSGERLLRKQSSNFNLQTLGTDTTLTRQSSRMRMRDVKSFETLGDSAIMTVSQGLRETQQLAAEGLEHSVRPQTAFAAGASPALDTVDDDAECEVKILKTEISRLSEASKSGENIAFVYMGEAEEARTCNHGKGSSGDSQV